MKGPARMTTVCRAESRVISWAAPRLSRAQETRIVTARLRIIASLRVEVRPQPTAAASSLCQEELRDRVELHVARAFVDRPDLRIAVELLDRIFLGISVAPKQLNRERRDPLGDLRGEQLRHRRFFRIRLARVFQPP